jgi:hypothetical protein
MPLMVCEIPSMNCRYGAMMAVAAERKSLAFTQPSSAEARRKAEALILLVLLSGSQRLGLPKSVFGAFI